MSPKSRFPSPLCVPLLLVLAACVSEGGRHEVVDDPQPITSEKAVESFDIAWKAIYDTHFDPAFNGVDWLALKDELRPAAETCTTEAELRAVIDDMIGRLGQSHFVLIPAAALPALEEAGDEKPSDEVAGGVGIDLRYRDDRMLVFEVDRGGPADRAGIRPGWTLDRAGESSTAELLERLLEAEGVLDPRKIAAYARKALRNATFGPIGEPVELALRDADDREVVVELERAERDVIAHAFGTALPTFHLRFRSDTLERGGRRIGWVHFTNWFLPMMKPIDEAMFAMRGHDGIVLDLRGNSGGAAAMCMGLAGHFFEEREVFGTMKLRDSEMRLVANPRVVDASGEGVEAFSGPVAILVDETSASASEVFSGGMQSTGRVRVFGETTAGAVLPARTTKLPTGDALLHAYGDFKTADGTLLEGRGVIPDETVKLTREELLQGRDPQLEAALSWIASHDRT
ncbi:MAG: S41 family peptidase [Planctomycetota bacterium]|nr:S41 family peptidase [Planctomycetota bacterium]